MIKLNKTRHQFSFVKQYIYICINDSLPQLKYLVFFIQKQNSMIRLYASSMYCILQRTKMPERERANSSTTSPISDSHQPIHLSCKPTALCKEIGKGKGARTYNACSITLSLSHG